MFLWEDDRDFTAWLDEKGFGTDGKPLDDDTLDLMYKAWEAGCEHGRRMGVFPHNR